ncbi:hypothetical protein PTKU46_94280 [Paraburkholderia terrae]
MLIVAFNWRWAFIVTGALGLLVAAVWFALYRDPNWQAPSREERSYLESDAVPAACPTLKLTFTEWRAKYGCLAKWEIVRPFRKRRTSG